VESLVEEADGSSLHCRVPVQMGHNFSSNRWISLNFLQEFPDAIFLEVYVESLLDEAEVSSLQTKYQFERPITFYPTV
jgi:hypothetical protein